MNELDALLALVDQFHVTDRALLRAKERARANADADSIAGLVAAARRYFGSMADESATQLEEIDRRLDDLYQRQYNLQAERGVTERRLGAARDVLAGIRTVEQAQVEQAQVDQGRPLHGLKRR